MAGLIGGRHDHEAVAGEIRGVHVRIDAGVRERAQKK
jgi:hypothetical protein